MKRSAGLSMKTKRAWFGFALALPFLIGFVLFFLNPMIQSIRFSFNNISTSAQGGLQYDFVGLSHYIRLFNSDTTFRTRLAANFTQLITLVPMIVIYSLFIAVLLNKKFRGRSFARVVFFLPVITASGIMLSIESSDYLLSAAQEVSADSAAMSAYSTGLIDIRSLLLSLNLGEEIGGYLQAVVDNLYTIVISSGVQITLLLAALQSISPSLYEASTIEGATAWESFWKITLPMVSPYVFLCVIYSIIDTFTSSTNGVIAYIQTVANGAQLDYGFASAMSWVYFGVIGLVLLVIGGVFFSRKMLFYQE